MCNKNVHFYIKNSPRAAKLRRPSGTRAVSDSFWVNRSFFRKDQALEGSIVACCREPAFNKIDQTAEIFGRHLGGGSLMAWGLKLLVCVSGGSL